MFVLFRMGKPYVLSTKEQVVAAGRRGATEFNGLRPARRPLYGEENMHKSIESFWFKQLQRQKNCRTINASWYVGTAGAQIPSKIEP